MLKLMAWVSRMKKRQLDCTNVSGVKLMSKSKQKAYVPSLFKGMPLVKLTPSLGWHGDKKYIGTIQKAVELDDGYYDEHGGKFVMGEGHWELVEDNT